MKSDITPKVKPKFALQGIPQYRSHKIVQALKIGRIDGTTIHPEDPTLPQVQVNPEYLDNYKRAAEQPGYFVQYDDGYQSWSPAKAFEEGYTQLAHGIDYAAIPLDTLRWWLALVDANPADLKPRIEQYLK